MIVRPRVLRDVPAGDDPEVTQKCAEMIASNSRNHSISYNSLSMRQVLLKDDVAISESLTVVSLSKVPDRRSEKLENSNVKAPTAANQGHTIIMYVIS